MINFFLATSTEYMPRTQVCLNSIRKFHPNSKIYVEKYDAPIITGYPSGLAKLRIHRLIQLLEQEDQNILMIGADCVLYDTLHKMEWAIESNNIVLVPHRITPSTVDKAGEFYRTGHACGDFLGVSRRSLPMLRWLLAQDMRNDPSQGLFYEQTHLSSMPFIFHDVNILRERSYNICYYNLDERDMNNKTIVHFSGFVQDKPERLSRHYSGPSITSGPVFDIYKEYNDLVKGNKDG